MQSRGYKIEVKNADPSPWATAVRREATEADPHKEDLAGTSIAAGRFFDDEEDSSRKADIAVGAPKANGLKGRVYLCKDCFWSGGSNTKWKLPKEQKSAVLEGTNRGSRFGHSVCSVNLNGKGLGGSGLDEVVVGAPLFSEGKVCYSYLFYSRSLSKNILIAIFF